MSRTLRPDATEFSPYYAGYVARVPDGDIIETLRSQLDATVALARSLAEATGAHRYAPGKWSIRQVLGHMADTERIMSYRALRVARGDTTPLPGFDENVYVQNARFDERTLASLTDELAFVRQSTIGLIAPLDDEELSRVGSANGAPITARALSWIIAGHERHHLAVLRERYL